MAIVLNVGNSCPLCLSVVVTARKMLTCGCDFVIIVL